MTIKLTKKCFPTPITPLITGESEDEKKELLPSNHIVPDLVHLKILRQDSRRQAIVLESILHVASLKKDWLAEAKNITDNDLLTLTETKQPGFGSL